MIARLIGKLGVDVDHIIIKRAKEETIAQQNVI
jgi:hypothetical protein